VRFLVGCSSAKLDFPSSFWGRDRGGKCRDKTIYELTEDFGHCLNLLQKVELVLKYVLKAGGCIQGVGASPWSWQC